MIQEHGLVKQTSLSRTAAEVESAERLAIPIRLLFLGYLPRTQEVHASYHCTAERLGDAFALEIAPLLGHGRGRRKRSSATTEATLRKQAGCTTKLAAVTRCAARTMRCRVAPMPWLLRCMDGIFGCPSEG